MSFNRKSKRNNNKRNKRSRDGNSRGRRPSTMPVTFKPIKQKPVQTRTVRYKVVTSSNGKIIESIDLLNIQGFVIAGDVNYYTQYESVRLMRVGVTALSNSPTGVGSVGFQWLGVNSNSVLDEVMLTQGVPAHRNFYPPPDSSCGWWYQSSSAVNPIFGISSNQVTVDPVLFIDIEYQYVVNDGVPQHVAYFSMFITTEYVFGSLPIGTPSSSTQLVPIGLASV
jgi:hypothetical protein